ncbi:MAG: transglutaminase-like domain-containing protein [Eubacteriales bacterium]|nr:transglutaminase-like domain-containing protein [Eubacteriales bacterium]
MYHFNRILSGLCVGALLAVSLSGCAGGGQSASGGLPGGVTLREQSVPLASTGAQDADLHDYIDLPDESAPTAAVNPVLDGLLLPQAAGTVTYGNATALIDASHTDQGYVMVKYAAGETKRIKVQVTRSGGTTYTYNLDADGAYDVFPLSQGSGAYQINVFRNVEGTRYAQVLGQSVEVSLSDELLPFLYPNQYVNFNENSKTVAQAKTLCADAGDELDKVSSVYNFVVGTISYDYELAKTVPSTYLPDVDRVLAAKKGICFDYAALMTAMLRSEGIPTKLVVGYTSRGEYHAWISVHISAVGWVNNVISFDGTSWKLMDPTFASTGKSSQSVLDFINNSANYTEKYCY